MLKYIKVETIERRNIFSEFFLSIRIFFELRKLRKLEPEHISTQEFLEK